VDEGRGTAEDGDESVTGLGATATAIGLTMVVFGGLLLASEVYPGAAWPQTAVAVELISASAWAISMYVGTIIMLLTMPGLIGVGAGLLVVAAVRLRHRQGVGWQAVVGAVLVLLGVTCVFNPPVGGPYVPIVLLAVGAGLLPRRAAAARVASDAVPATGVTDR
jgi:uncharacterized membrane protein HdeD (DUF308 family)